MEIKHLFAIFLSIFVMLAYGLEFKNFKYCGPEDKTFHFNVTPWPVITPGQDAKITLTFTPRVNVIHATMESYFKITTKDGKSFVFKETGDACHQFPGICKLPAGETVSMTFIKRLRTIPLGLKGFSGKLRAEFFNQEKVMFMCLEVEGVDKIMYSHQVDKT